MLRGEHVIARLARGRVYPHRLSSDQKHAVKVAEELCALYDDHIDKPRSELVAGLAAIEEELGPRLDSRRGFKIARALAKLLDEQAQWTSPTSADPYTVRTRLFELAASMPELPASDPGLLETATREEVIQRVSTETGLGNPNGLMYADRQSAQVLSEFDRPSAEELIQRYNVAQVQGILYSAKEMTVDIGEEANARSVFHYIKLMDLIYRLEPRQGGYRIHLDGPLSIFGSTRKYGLRLAKFLPGLLLTAPWRLSATVDWRGRDARLQLDSESSGLVSHYTGPKDYREGNDVREAFVQAWNRSKDTGDWELQPGADILALPELRSALVPDFTLENRPTGKQVHLEILGFWSERTLVDRVSLIRAAANVGHRVLIAASENLGVGSEVLSSAMDGAVLPFKNRLKVKAVLDAADAALASSPQ
ncbi:DUF790 family protein [soil metagenome]